MIKFDIRFTSRPIRTLWCQAALMFACKEAVESGVEPAGVDKKTASYLQYLLGQRFWSCRQGEKLLLPGEDRLKAPKLLIKGLGRLEDLDQRSVSEEVREAAKALCGLGVNDLAVRMPPLWGRGAYASLLKDTCLTIVGALSEGEGPSDQAPRIIFCLDAVFLEEAQEAASEVKEALEDCPVIVEEALPKSSEAFL